MRARGADLSVFQDDAQLQRAINEHLDFAFVKATEGDAYVNPRARLQIARLEANTVHVGLYHFLTHDVDGARQWDFFERTAAHWTKTPLVVACDQETDGHGVLVPDAIAAAFIRRGHQAGYEVGRYGDVRVMGRTLGEDWRWRARWAKTPPAGRWDFWQFAAGAGGGPDWNVFRGNRAELEAWWKRHGGRRLKGKAHPVSPYANAPARWWLHDELEKRALGPYRLPRLVAALTLYLARHRRSARFELVKQ
jgi:lysozyme